MYLFSFYSNINFPIVYRQIKHCIQTGETYELHDQESFPRKMFLMIQKLVTKLIKIFISHSHSDRADRRTSLVNNAVLFFECLQEGHVLRGWLSQRWGIVSPDVAPIDRIPHSSDNSRTQDTIWWCTSMGETVRRQKKEETKTKQRFGNKTCVEL